MKLYKKYILALSLLTLICQTAHARLQGQPYIDSLINELRVVKEDTNKVEILNHASWLYSDIDPGKGIKYGQQALDIATKLGWKIGIAKANTNLASNYDSKTDYSKSLEYYATALKLFEELGDKRMIGGTLCNMGSDYQYQSAFPKALEYYLKALKILEEIGNKPFMAYTLGNIGNIYLNQKEFPKALDYFARALKLSEEIGDKDDEANIIGNMSSIYSSQGAHYKSLEYNFKALKMYEDMDNKNGIALATGNIAGEYVSIKKYSLGIAYGLQALDMDKEISENRQAIYVLSDIGKAYLGVVEDTAKGQGRANDQNEIRNGKSVHGVSIPKDKHVCLRLAQSYLILAADSAKKMNILAEVQDNNKILSGAYMLSGDYRRALECYKIFIATRDSVFSKENDKKIIAQQMTYEYEKKEAIAKGEQEKKDIVQRNIRNSTMAGMAGLLIFSFVVFRQRNKVRKEMAKVEVEKARSEELLLNILPAEVAEELKENGSAEAKLINEVTVLFTDFKGFTQLSEKLSPQVLVALINECFSAFDHIMQKHGVEKIKTIGDAYMAAGGLPTANNTHSSDVVKAALEIQAYMLRHKAEKNAAGELFFEIRIGVHTGPVVAGIVGVKKFQYDIWGDTVNTASRMESSGEVGKVNISETTYELVKDKFTCEYRGEIKAKGKGDMKMYFVP